MKRIGLTLGDPAGVGPELALRIAADFAAKRDPSLVIVGSAAVLRRVARQLSLAVPRVVDAEQLSVHSHGVVVLDIDTLDAEVVEPGVWSRATGAASYAWVRHAIELALAGELDAVVTGPIQKEAWHAAGIAFPGHTELIAEMTGARDVRMMLTSDVISCVLATIHIPHAEVATRLTREDVWESIRLGAEAMRRRLGCEPRVTVCGLNPHAGEHGLFSHGEEERVILPAIEQALRLGMTVRGPVAPDTAFVPAMRQATDLYVCMYHDQGLIPLKALAFDDAVNVTLGSNIVRTSVDHGTAMDIAWQGIAKVSSLRAACEMAVDLAS